MDCRGRAYFNQLCFETVSKGQDLRFPWAYHDYRSLEEKDLYLWLSELGLYLDRKTFLDLAVRSPSPEHLTAHLCPPERQDPTHQKIYLILFELWRRFLPEKETLSIFADSLDRLIDRFECQDLTETEEELLIEKLKTLEDLLDDYGAHGLSDQEAFLFVTSYFAYDLEYFIYSFILDQISIGNEVLASELIDGFEHYVQDRLFFDFLKIRLFYATEPEAALTKIDLFLEELAGMPEPILWLDLLSFLSAHGDHNKFRAVYLQLLDHLQSEMDLKELLLIIADYYDFIDQDERYQEVLALYETRSDRPGYEPLELSYQEKLILEELVPHEIKIL